jgi:hypothetical protein
VRAKVRRRQTRSGVRWYVALADTDGERAHGGYRTRAEARRAAATLLADSGRGHYVAPAKLTLGDYLLDEWLPSRETADLSETTRDTDRTVVEAWVLPWIGGVPLQKLSARDLDKLYRELRSRGGRGGRPLRGKSVRNAHVTLHKALHDAMRRGHVLVNVADAVDPPARDDSVERIAWAPDEVRTFLEVAAGDRLHAIWRTALATGLRRGELMGCSGTTSTRGRSTSGGRCSSGLEPSGSSAACTYARRSRTAEHAVSGSTNGPSPTSAGGRRSRTRSDSRSAPHGKPTAGSASRERGS